jgi:selT/selW/selH-like putative selenoprotein
LTETQNAASLKIVFCFECGYTRRAIKLAENVMEEFGDFLPGGITIVPGYRESFDVYLNDQPLFSRKGIDRFPNDREIEDKLIDLLEG